MNASLKLLYAHNTMPRHIEGVTHWQERAIIGDLCQQEMDFIIQLFRTRINKLNEGIRGKKIEADSRLDDIAAVFGDIVSDIKGFGEP